MDLGLGYDRHGTAVRIPERRLPHRRGAADVQQDRYGEEHRPRSRGKKRVSETMRTPNPCGMPPFSTGLTATARAALAFFMRSRVRVFRTAGGQKMIIAARFIRILSVRGSNRRIAGIDDHLFDLAHAGRPAESGGFLVLG